MLVCHCKAVYEGRIREEIARGASDAFAIAKACGAGTGCGGCVPTIDKLLSQHGRWPGCPPRVTRATVHS